VHRHPRFAERKNVQELCLPAAKYAAEAEDGGRMKAGEALPTVEHRYPEDLPNATTYTQWILAGG